MNKTKGRNVLFESSVHKKYESKNRNLVRGERWHVALKLPVASVV